MSPSPAPSNAWFTGWSHTVGCQANRQASGQAAAIEHLNGASSPWRSAARTLEKVDMMFDRRL